MGPGLAGSSLLILAELGKSSPDAPLYIFGATSLIAAGLVLFLPETKGVSPPSTVEEGERLSREENLTMVRRTRTVMLMFQGGGRAQLVLQEEPPSSSWCWRT